MKIVGLEEHYATPEVVRAWQGLDAKWQDSATKFSVEAELGRRLQSLGDERLAVMDDAGVDTQVLSLTSPGLFNLDAADAKMAELARVCRAGTTAMDFVEWLVALKARIRIPAKLGEKGVTKQHIPRLVDIAVNDICHQTNPKPCTAKDFEKIFSAAI